MSRFAGAFNFGGGGDDSSSEDERSESGGEENQEATPAAAQKVSTYFMGSDDEDEERHFKLGKDKKWEALEKVLDECRKHANISDFNAMDSDLPKLAGEIEKNGPTLFQDKGDKLPNRVLKVLLQFEDTINEVTNAAKKKMNKTNAQAHNKIKQKFKKYIQGTGEGEHLYETQLANYRENPQDSQQEEEEEEEKKSEEDEEEEEEEEEEEKKDDAEEEDDYYDEEDDDTAAAKKGAAAEAAKEKAGGEDEYYDEEADYYDEEDDEKKEDDASDEELTAADSSEIPAKLKQKYAFLWKTREEMTASERRWKWVKKESLPTDLVQLMDKLTKKKKSGPSKED